MQLYLAGTDVSGRCHILDGLKNLGLLVSYWYIVNGKGWRVVEWANERNVPVFLDSGAFSAMNSGAAINLNEYIDFCLAHQKRFEVVASLDVIMDHKATAHNHMVTKEAGVNSIPTFHVREPFEFLSELAADNDYIALGVAGMQTSWSHRSKIPAWITRCFQVARLVNPTIGLHGFAITSPKLMQMYPWRSVDSTTWLFANAHKELLIRHGATLKRVGTGKPENLRKYGGRFRHLLNSGDKALKHNAQTMLNFASDITRFRNGNQE